jgi:hypothetical protein
MKARVLEILRECDRLAGESVERCGVGNWMGELDWVLTFDEKRAIRALWDRMPGSMSFHSAFCQWAGGIVEVYAEAHRLYMLSQTKRNNRW